MSEVQRRAKITIANCGGFWGDDPTAARRQIEGGPVDYLVMDYLAEITMALLHKAKSRNPEAGYTADFLSQLRDVLVQCVAGDVKVITNAGGINPLACKAAVQALAAELGVADKVRVGVVMGDDIFGEVKSLVDGGEPLINMDTGDSIDSVVDRVLSANVYLGARGVVKALEMGANIVITGRVTDTGVTLAPMLYEFGWSENDWDKVATGIVAGHIIECGVQCTGGNFTDWRKVPRWTDMGYPLIEADADGSFVVTKHPDTGGLVSVHTVTEQLLYEMGEAGYLAPDCVARFDSIQLEQDGADRVRVSGIRGQAPPEKLKVSISFANGYRAFGRMLISGPDVLAKAKVCEDGFWASAGGRENYEDTHTCFIGYDGAHPPYHEHEPSEVILQVAARDTDRKKLADDFAPQLVPKVLSSIPGITYLADQGRPRPSEVVGYWPALISRDRVNVDVIVGDENVRVDCASPQGVSQPFSPVGVNVSAPASGELVQCKLIDLCLSRSGDKGDTCNVGLIARSDEIYTWMVSTITPEFVKERFGGICHGSVERSELPNLRAVNFLLHESLGGGGTLSLLLDPQGKTYAQYLLAATVEIDSGLLRTV